MKFHNQPLGKKRSIAKDHSAAASFLTKQKLDSSSIFVVILKDDTYLGFYIYFQSLRCIYMYLVHSM